MSIELLNLLLYLPFLAVVAVVGTIYCIKGYKQGLWNALISLGVSAGSALLSLLVSRPLAGLLAKPLVSLIPVGSVGLDGAGSFQDLIFSFVEGLTGDVLAILFFSLLLFLLVTVLKPVVNKLVPKSFATESKGKKWAGLGVRVLDAVLVTLLLLLPLYGTVATFIKPASTFAQMQFGSDSQAVLYMSAVSDHTMLSLYQAGPAAWVQKGLSGFKVGDAEVDLVNIAGLLNEALEKYERVEAAESDEARVEALTDLNRFLRENLIEEDWFFTMVTQLAAEVEAHAAEIPEEDRALVLDLISLVKTSKEEFASNGVAVLDFLSYVLEGDAIDALIEENYDALPADFDAKLGALLNHSAQSVTLKKMMMVEILSELYEKESHTYGNTANDALSSEGNAAKGDADEKAWEVRRKEAREAANAAMELYWKGDGRITDPQLQVQEGRAFFRCLFGSRRLSLLEGVARHPFFGPDFAASFLTKESLAQNELSLWEEELQYLEKHPEILQELTALLSTYPAKPLSEVAFEDAVTALLQVGSFLEAPTSTGYAGLNRAAAGYAVAHIGKDRFAAIPGGEELYELLKIYADQGEGRRDLELHNVYSLLSAAKNPARWPETSADGEVDDSAYWEFAQMLRYTLSDAVAVQVFRAAVTQKGNDPFGLGRNLTEGQVRTLKKTLSEYEASPLFVGSVGGMVFTPMENAEGTSAMYYSVNGNTVIGEGGSIKAENGEIKYIYGDSALSGQGNFIFSSAGEDTEEAKALRKDACDAVAAFFGVVR